MVGGGLVVKNHMQGLFQEINCKFSITIVYEDYNCSIKPVIKLSRFFV